MRVGNLRWIAALLLSVPATEQAQTIAVASYPVTRPSTGGPNAITVGPDGAVWFTVGSGSIGRMTAASVGTLYPIPTKSSSPSGITVGPDGALWFTEYAANQIGRITTNGTFTEYPVPTANSGPFGITAGPDGALWFTEYTANQIGRITTTGAITEYRNVYGAEPEAITAGPDGALWYTEYIQVARITTSGAETNYQVTSTSYSPQGITMGPDDALWFTGANQIGRITTTGAVTEYPTYGSQPQAIATGPDGALWFTDSYSNTIGRINTAGAVSNYPAPPTSYYNTGTTGISNGPDGALWFTEYGAGWVGLALFTTASLTANPQGLPSGSSISFNGSGFDANETVEIYKNGIGSAVLTTGVANSSGSFNAGATNGVPVAPFGYRLFLAVGETSKKIGAAAFSTTPYLSFTFPNGEQAGNPITVSGSGFAPFDSVQVYWDNPLTLLGTTTADITGAFSGSAAVTGTIPASAVGQNYVTGVGVNVPQAKDARGVNLQ